MRLGSGRNRCKTNATEDVHHFFSARFLICGALHLNQDCFFNKMICKTLYKPMAYVHKKTTYATFFRTIVGEGAPSFRPNTKRGPSSIVRRVTTGACGTGKVFYSLQDSRYCPAVPIVKILPTVLPGRGPASVATSNSKVRQGLAVVPATPASRSKSPTS